MSGKENDCKNIQEDSFVYCHWKETCLPPDREPNQSTHRFTLQFIFGKHPDCHLLLCLFSNISFLDGAVGKGLQSAFTTHCNAADINPHERFLIMKDPTLVKAAHLTCLNLPSRLPTQHQADFVVRMYAGIEEKLNFWPHRKDWTQWTSNVNGKA